MNMRTIGLDIGAETIKLVELTRKKNGTLEWTRRAIREHHKEPGVAVKELLAEWGWEGVAGAAVSGRLSRNVELERIPVKQAQVAGYGFLFGEGPATIVSIGSHGFSVLELRGSHLEMFRENSRCSQGTGNFLRQLVERFDMTIEEASELCADVDDPAPLSGRCPVILKTDMTHLANKGEPRERILAGLYDAVCENVQVLIKPRLSPPKVTLVGGVARSLRIRDNFDRFLSRHKMELIMPEGDDGLYMEALGCAVIAAEKPGPVPSMDDLFAPPEEHELDRLPPLSQYMSRVKRMEARPRPKMKKDTRLILGFDIGSTGSKVVALDVAAGEEVWESYVNTNGAPVEGRPDPHAGLRRQLLCQEPAPGRRGHGQRPGDRRIPHVHLLRRRVGLRAQRNSRPR